MVGSTSHAARGVQRRRPREPAPPARARAVRMWPAQPHRPTVDDTSDQTADAPQHGSSWLAREGSFGIRCGGPNFFALFSKIPVRRANNPVLSPEKWVGAGKGEREKPVSRIEGEESQR